jgi:hypothetical protein
MMNQRFDVSDVIPTTPSARRVAPPIPLRALRAPSTDVVAAMRAIGGAL